MRFRVLGTLEIRSEQGWIHLDRPRRRAVLAYLLLTADRTVATGELTEAIWGAHPPSTSHSQIQNDVAAIRKVLATCGDPATILTRTGGYELRTAPDDIDYGLFRRQVSAAREAAERGDWTDSARLIEDALTRWRGPALADIVAPFAEPARARLEEERLDATERLAESRIAVGAHEEQISVLRELVAAHPMRERPAALLMRALHRAGRRAEALGVARDTRAYLRDHHGLDPSRTFLETERQVMRGVAEAATDPNPFVPRQLPADVRLLAGRGPTLAELSGLAGRAGSGRIVLITGPGGVGKTALAVRWGHEQTDTFRDGAIFVDLHGYERRPPLTPLAGLHRALTGLGVGASQLPSDVDDASALFRSLTAEGRYLVVLDNARTPDQVRPLLPGGGSCFVLVTSRDSLPGLSASHSVARIELPVLREADGVHLLESIIGRARVAAETAAAVSLVDTCGGLPLAVRIVGAQLLDAPERTLDRQVRILREHRLSALSSRGDPSGGVRSVIRTTCATLPRSAQRLFRLLALLPYVDIDVAAAAAADGRREAPVRSDLDRLLGVHLLERRGEDRYGFHDLPRAYAAERADRIESPAERAASVAGVLAHYRRLLDDASRILYLPTMRLVDGAAGAAPPPVASSFADRADALAWLTGEHPNLLASVDFAHDQGRDDHAWHLAAALRGHHVSTGSWHDLSTTSAAAVAAATVAGDQRREALARLGNADALRRLGRYDDAVAEYQRALNLAASDEWLECQAACLGNLGIVHLRLGQLTAAVDCYTRDLEICRKIGWAAAEAIALAGLGNCAHYLGRHTDAIAAYENAAALAQTTSSAAVQALACLNVGTVSYESGDLVRARSALDRALALFAGLGRTADEIMTHAQVARAYASVDRDEARRHLRRARDMADGQGAAALDPTLRVQLHVSAAAVLAAHDDLTSAVTELEHALEQSQEFGLAFQRAGILIQASALSRRLGRANDARAHAVAARQIAERGEFHGLARAATTALEAIDP